MELHTVTVNGIALRWHERSEGSAALLATLFTGGHDRRERMREPLDRHWRHFAAHGGVPALWRQMRALDARDTRAIADNLPQNGWRVRMVRGASNSFLKIGYGWYGWYGCRLAHDLGARLDRVEAASHFVPVDHPERVAAAVTGLQDRLLALPPLSGAAAA